MLPFFDGVVAKEFAMASYLIPNLQHRIWAKLVLCDTLRQQTHGHTCLQKGTISLLRRWCWQAWQKSLKMRTIIPKAKIKAPAFASATEPKDSACGRTQKHKGIKCIKCIKYRTPGQILRQFESFFAIPTATCPSATAATQNSSCAPKDFAMES